jgi:multisubunit Na+/H+ antiporter MnhF subunit
MQLHWALSLVALSDMDFVSTISSVGMVGFLVALYDKRTFPNPIHILLNLLGFIASIAQ